MGLIYCLTFPNGKKYIGQTIRTVERRIKEHKSLSNKCPLVEKAYKKYGSFDYETLIECENDQLDYWECYFISELDTLSPQGYNLTSGGEGAIPSEETRQKMRESHANRVVHDVWRKAISEGLKGHKHSDATKEKIRQARLENPTVPSEENRRKINESIRTDAVRDKMSLNHRKHGNGNIPRYIHYVHRKDNRNGCYREYTGYVVRIPGKPEKQFASNKLTDEEKLKLAIEYKAQQLTKLNVT